MINKMEYIWDGETTKDPTVVKVSKFGTLQIERLQFAMENQKKRNR